METEMNLTTGNEHLRLPHTADFFSGSNRVKICRDFSLPHTSRFLSRLTAFRLDFSFDLRHVGKDPCSRDFRDNSSLAEVGASPDKFSWSTAH